MIGDQAMALDLLEELLSRPSGVWQWKQKQKQKPDPVEGNARFQAPLTGDERVPEK